MQNDKLNTRYEFGRRINFEPFTKEGLMWRAAAAAKAAATAAPVAADGGEGSAALPQEDLSAPVIEGKVADDEPGAVVEAAVEPALVQYGLHPKEYYEYKLKGVVVHNGTADRGHYWSYVRDSDSSDNGLLADDPAEDWKSERWYQFNDSSVSEFYMSPDVLESECFGGPMAQVETDDFGQTVSVTKDQVRARVAVTRV